MRSVERTFALGDRLRQRREIGEEFRVLVEHALEDRVVVEIVTEEWSVLLQQPGLDHLVAGADQPLDRADRHPRVPIEPFYPFGRVGDVEAVEEAGGDFRRFLGVLAYERGGLRDAGRELFS